ncbi:TPA: hypothetical protein ACHKRG_001321 [Enterococcus faecium]
MITTKELFEKLYIRNNELAKGIIYLGEKTDKGMITKPFPVAKISEIDQFCNDLAINRYFTPNSYTIDKKDRTKENVLSLNSFFIDIDCIKKGISIDYALEQVKKRTKIPFSAIISSGNGLHLYYFIDFVYIPKRTQNTSTIINLYESTMSDLVKVFADLGADDGAKSSNNYLRLPNTINVKEKIGVNKVEILELNDYVYTLKDIAILYKNGYADYLNNTEKQIKAKERKEQNKKKTPDKLKTTLSLDRVSDLIKLIDLRNGKVETRNDFLRLCIFFNKFKAYELNSHFQNPEDLKVIDSMIKYHDRQKAKNDSTLNKKMYWTNQQIIKTLNITSEEQKQLKTIISVEERNKRNKLRMQKVREIPKLALKVKKDLSILYVNKFKNILKNEEIAKNLNITDRTVRTLKSKNINIFETNQDLKYVLVNSKKQSKIINKIAHKNIEDMTKVELKKVINFLDKVA